MKCPPALIQFSLWLNSVHRETTEVVAARGKVHDCSGMTFRFEGKDLHLDMRPHVKAMLKDSPIKFRESGGISAPAGLDSFEVDTGEQLSKCERGILNKNSCTDVICL